MKNIIYILLFICWNTYSQTPPMSVNVLFPRESNGAIPVNIQDQHSTAVTLYLYRHDVSTGLKYNSTIDSSFITLDTVTGVEEGDAITIYEGAYIFQSIVLDTTGNVVQLASPLDYSFTTLAVVHVGPWDMKVNGSVTDQSFEIHPPPGADFDIYTVIVSITDGTEMDSKKFGGITQLTKGIVLRIVNGTTHNLGLIVNNMGLSEHGYTIEYDSKAPAGVFGLRASKNYLQQNGVSLRLEGATQDTYKILIQDDLSALSSMNITINGHYVTQ